MRPRNLLLASTSSLFLLAGGLLAACGTSTAKSSSSEPACSSSSPKLTVSATGQATGTPNLLTMVLGVQNTASSAQQALATNNKEATAVIATLKFGGIQSSDIQTTGFSVNPTYGNNGNITGYSVDNTVIAKVHDKTGKFSSVGSLIDSVTSQAGNDTRLNGLNFSVEDTTSLEATARSRAVHAAMVHARSMAAAAGEHLGGICSLNDESSPTYYPQNYAAFSAGATQTNELGAPAPLEPGSQQVTAQVKAVYSLDIVQSAKKS